MKKTSLTGNWDIKILARRLLDSWEGNSRIFYLTRNPQGLSEGMEGAFLCTCTFVFLVTHFMTCQNHTLTTEGGGRILADRADSSLL